MIIYRVANCFKDHFLAYLLNEESKYSKVVEKILEDKSLEDEIFLSPESIYFDFKSDKFILKERLTLDE